MQVIMEILHRTYIRQYLTTDVLVIVDNVVETVGTEIIACLQVDVFAERKTS